MKPETTSIQCALVTGATGFIGRRLCRYLQQQGVRVRALARHAASGPWDELVITELGVGEVQPALLRFLVHSGAAVGLLSGASLSIHELNLPWADYSLPLWIVWFTNLYNFMDGIDGLAAGMGACGFAFFGILGLSASGLGFAAVALIIAGACLGFLFVNFPPARIFMGDVGSSVLGFLAAGLSLWADRDHIFPLWMGVLIFSPFVVDATVTLCRRVLNKDAFWRAHRSFLSAPDSTRLDTP